MQNRQDTPLGGYLFILVCFSRYNDGMENDTKYSPSNSQCCGRPINYAPEKECKFNDCCLSETCGCSLGRIKKDADPCKSCCVIPSVTVETVDGITNLANCFVHVAKINTTFYIDDKHRPMIIWAGPVEVELPADVQTTEQWVAFIKSFALRSQFLYVKFKSSDDPTKYIIDSFYFDRTGKIYWSGEFEEIEEA